MNNHTPAPWNVAGTFICANNGDRIAYMAEHDEQALADARLIAAAPKMHALLLKIHAELSHVASADADPSNWEGYTLHRIEQLLWPKEEGSAT